MKKFNNIEFKVGNPDTGITNYVSMLLAAVNMPATGQAFSPQQNYEQTELYNKLAKFKDDTEVELEDADFKAVMVSYDNMQLLGRSDEAAAMYKYFKDIR